MVWFKIDQNADQILWRFHVKIRIRPMTEHHYQLLSFVVTTLIMYDLQAFVKLLPLQHHLTRRKEQKRFKIDQIADQRIKPKQRQGDHELNLTLLVIYHKEKVSKLMICPCNIIAFDHDFCLTLTCLAIHCISSSGLPKDMLNNIYIGAPHFK